MCGKTPTPASCRRAFSRNVEPPSRSEFDRWHEILARSPALTTVAEHVTRPIGFISVGPRREDDVEVEEEVWALYVQAAWWGQVSGALLAATLAGRPGYLWVLGGNDRAIAFYQKYGFVEDGVTRTADHGTELRMVRRG